MTSINEVLIDGGLVDVGSNDLRENEPEVMEKVVEEEYKEEEEVKPRLLGRRWFSRKRKDKEEYVVENDVENDYENDVVDEVENNLEKNPETDLETTFEMDQEDNLENDSEKDLQKDVEKDLEQDVEKKVENEGENPSDESDNNAATYEEKSGEDTDEEESKIAEKTDLIKTFSNFGHSLLNVCTFGLFSSGITATDEPFTPQKIVQDLTVSEGQSHLMDQYIADSERDQYAGNRDRALMSNYSIASDGNDTTPRTVSRIFKARKLQSVVCYSAIIAIFLAMAALFAIGGVLLKRNGW